ncbi:MAG: T9SS type A sorting domain-containing protein [Ignavibacteria bacterium]|nr:T9SS type A sorting domain-containing protein [Ignavibacteria bacterium]
MKKFRKYLIIYLSILVYTGGNIYSQVFNPVNLGETGTRYEDMYFSNESTGIIVHFNGRVLKTYNKGASWVLLQNDLNPLLRSIGMFDGNTGIIGTLDRSHVLYRTTNGGVNWAHISANITGTLPGGICGISIVNSTTAFACGRYNSPANVIKTTDAGLNWISIPVDISMARSLVDCHFWSADSGFVVGGYSSNNNHETGNSVILFTTNGGANWSRVYRSSRSGEWCWKVQFVNRRLGYASIERTGAPTFILKTTNGGQNWGEIRLPDNITNLEGIGFINEQTGWVGGWGQNYNMPCYRTTNGGWDWHLAGWGTNVNRFRFVNDSTIYALGKTVYKFKAETFVQSTYIPQLLSPQNGSVDMPLSFLIDWNDVVPFASYDVQISKTPAFTTTVFNRTGVGQSHSFIPVSDHNLILKPYMQYYWRVRSNTTEGLSAWSSVWSFTTGAEPEEPGDGTHIGDIPKEYRLYENYPNPFNPETNIRFDIPNDANVKITVYDQLGKEVKVLADEFKQAGSYEVSFDASYLSSGTYFYKLTAGSFTDIKKMVLIK